MSTGGFLRIVSCCLHLLDASRWVQLCEHADISEDIVDALRLCELACEGTEVVDAVYCCCCYDPLDRKEVDPETDGTDARVLIQVQQPTCHY